MAWDPYGYPKSVFMSFVIRLILRRWSLSEACMGMCEATSGIFLARTGQHRAR